MKTTVRFRISVARLGCAAFVLGVVWTGTAAGAPIDRLRYQEFPELEGRVVSRVLILGNNDTREIVFRREMRLTEGATFSSEDLWRDWERIVDLGIFAHVEVDAVPSGNGALVVVSVFERPRWFVTPVADYDFGSSDITLGYRVRFRNLGGMNQSLRSNGKAGEKDRFSVDWATPWIGERRQSLRVALRVELPREGTNELRTSSLSVSSTSFVGDFKQTRLGVTGFGRLDVLRRDGTFPGGDVRQLSPVIGIGASRDKRNVRIDPSRGTLAVGGIEFVSGWTSPDEISYLRTNLDLRGFFSIGWGAVLASRVGTTLSTGKVPDYRRIGIGGSRSIRGQPTNVAVGTNVGRASLELRFPILARRRFSLPIPFVPRRISNVDLRIDGEIFADVGSAWEDFVDLRTAQFRPGYGFGLRIFLPIIELARIEIAFDQSGSPTIYLTDTNII